jgi:crotonobetainyl-CoA hydratase
MCADMIVAADDTRFGLPETAAGIIGHCGVVHRAVRRLPHAIAMAMVLSDERLDARSAERFGLVNAVVKAEELLRTALELASRVAACSPLANQAAKAAAICGLDESLTDALAARYPAIERYALTNDSKEAMQARSQGRRPKWSGC